MASVDEIIERLGGPDRAAQLTAVGTEAIRKWRQGKSIPARHWPVILKETGLTLTDMPGADMPGAAAPEAPGADGRPPGATAALVLADGTVMWGRGFGAHATTVGEVCFNTSITGYQEILTDPSYAGQIITFTFPHVFQLAG